MDLKPDVHTTSSFGRRKCKTVSALKGEHNWSLDQFCQGLEIKLSVWVIDFELQAGGQQSGTVPWVPVISSLQDPPLLVEGFPTYLPPGGLLFGWFPNE